MPRGAGGSHPLAWHSGQGGACGREPLGSRRPGCCIMQAPSALAALAGLLKDVMCFEGHLFIHLSLQS